MWYIFKLTFNRIAEIHAPMRRGIVRSKYTPWLTDEIKKAIKIKSEIY